MSDQIVTSYSCRTCTQLLFQIFLFRGRAEQNLDGWRGDYLKEKHTTQQIQSLEVKASLIGLCRNSNSTEVKEETASEAEEELEEIRARGYQSHGGLESRGSEPGGTRVRGDQSRGTRVGGPEPEGTRVRGDQSQENQSRGTRVKGYQSQGRSGLE